MDHHACGFVDDGDVGVLVDDVEGNFFSAGAERRRNERAGDGDGFAAVELDAGLGGCAVEEDFLVGDERLDARAAEAVVGGGEGERKILVEALVCGFGGDGDGEVHIFRIRGESGAGGASGANNYSLKVFLTQLHPANS